MSPSQAIAIIRRFNTNHPEWKITAEPSPDGVAVRFIFSGHDSRNPRNKGQVIHQQTLLPMIFEDERRLRHWILTSWERAWLHEAHEWLDFDGELVHNPHEETA